ncbi:MAG: RHS repeat-associated core domain-containing protein [Candidatus Saccharicenans sp.]|nr:RHS repeat-associated core domain-containing protein [Candidatus Saccharicenans sp.]
MVAEYQPDRANPTTGQYYYTTDQINSTRVVTDDSGNVVYAAVHDPYGGVQQTWVNTFNPELKFSGEEQDAESGLYYFGARYYDLTLYRFLSPDPVIPTDSAIFNPQWWNLYSYCGSNPLRYFDPDGQSFLIFVASGNLLFVFDKNGNLVGVFDASNNLVSNAKGHYPEGRWRYLHHTHKTFESGFFGFDAPSEDPGSLGIHAGHKDWKHPTCGCIRTTEEAISVIHRLHGENLADGLEFLVVVWDEDFEGIISKIEFYLRGAGKDDKTIEKVIAKIEENYRNRTGPLAFLYDYFFWSFSPIPPEAF